MRRREFLALVPLVLGALGASLVALAAGRAPVVYLRADLGSALILLGLAASAGLALVFGVARLTERARDGARVAAAAGADADRRRLMQRLDHELKNPLTAIRVGVANLSELGEGEARRDALDTVSAQVTRLSRLAADLRKLAELETRPIERAPVDLAAVLREVVELVGERPEAADRRVGLVLPRAPWPLPGVEGDQDLLFLALHNLVENAVKFTGAGDTVEVRAFEEGDGVVVEVADTGPGIPEAELPHVWEELYRAQAARSVQGTGLGLALVRAVVARHGGTAGVRSRVDQGTVFTVRLPATSRYETVTQRP